MNPGEVQVYILAGRGKPKVQTQHREVDAATVREALDEVGRASVVKETEAWPSKLRDKYIAALRKRGLVVHVVDNRSSDHNVTRRNSMDFGDAIKAMKSGKKVAREGWNGKNMHVYLNTFVVPALPVRFEPCIVMLTASGMHQPGWLASQADILSEDWSVVG